MYLEYTKRRTGSTHALYCSRNYISSTTTYIYAPLASILLRPREFSKRKKETQIILQGAIKNTVSKIASQNMQVSQSGLVAMAVEWLFNAVAAASF